VPISERALGAEVVTLLEESVMANGNILDDLAKAPWWVSVVLSFIVFVSAKILLPAIHFQNPIYAGMAKMGHELAGTLALILLLPAAISALTAWKKGQLFKRQTGIGSIRELSWREFEELVGEAYRRQGYSVAETGGGGADGGIDLVLRKNGEKLLVQCKHWKMARIGVKVVRELYGVVAGESASGGIVICSGTFTQEAHDFAKGKPIELVEGAALGRMVGQKKASLDGAASSQTHSVTERCPLCGATMVLRVAKKGTHAGEKFWGCSSFPKCHGKRVFAD
jgi:restriction system protein